MDAGEGGGEARDYLPQQQIARDAVLIGEHILFLEITEWNRNVYIT